MGRGYRGLVDVERGANGESCATGVWAPGTMTLWRLVGEGSGVVGEHGFEHGVASGEEVGGGDRDVDVGIE